MPKQTDKQARHDAVEATGSEIVLRIDSTIRPGVKRSVAAYLAAHQKTRRLAWPMVDEAIQMLEAGLEGPFILGQFRSAFAELHRLKYGDFTQSEYSYFRKITTQVLYLAKAGRDKVNQFRRKKNGFWLMVENVNADAEPVVEIPGEMEVSESEEETEEDSEDNHEWRGGGQKKAAENHKLAVLNLALNHPDQFVAALYELREILKLSPRLIDQLARQFLDAIEQRTTDPDLKKLNQLKY